MAAKISEEQVKEIKEAFFMFDVQNRGKMEVGQLGTAVRSLSQNPSEAEVKAMIKEADPKGSGFIDEKTFVNVVSKHWREVNSEEDIIDAFKVFDREGTGYLGAKELTNVLMNIGERLTQEEVDDMLKVANLDSDDQLNYTTLTQTLLANIRR